MTNSGDQRIHLKSKAQQSAGKSRIWLFLALFSAVLAATPLLVTPGLVNTRGGGDSPFLLIRTYEMAEGLRTGQFPVRWMGQAAYGLGYPFFSFYAALPYYLAAFLCLGTGSILWSIKLTQLIGFLSASAGMYALARRWLDSPPAAALAAVAYTFAPFHLVNVYVRADSLSEFFAFVWYPLILLSLHRLFKQPSVGRAGTMAMTCAALVVTHNISAMIFSPFALLYALYLTLDRSTQIEQKARAIGLALLALALAALLSAWFWLPMLGELDEIQLGEEQTSGHFNYSAHFRSRDLIQPTVWFDYDPDVEPTPYAMGLTQTVLTLTGFGALTWHWLRRHKLDTPSVLILLMLLIATLMITPLSRPLWDNLPPLRLTQFPWRFLSVQALATSLLIAYLAATASRPSVVAVPVALALAVAALVGLRIEPLYITDADVTLERLALYEYLTGNIGTTIQAEWLPRRAVPRPYVSEALLTVPSKPPPTVLEGTVESAKLLERRPHRERWQIDITSGTARLAFHTLFFPGWQAQVDGQAVEIASWPGLGYISLELGKGSHQVYLRLGNSALRQQANWATVVGIVILLTLGVLARPWQRLAQRHLWMAGGAIAAAVALGALFRLLGSSAVQPGVSDLTMDFIRQPYLHHNPAGTDFGATRLLRYTMSSDRAAAGDTVAIEIEWTDGRIEELTAQVDLVFAVHEALEDPPTLATSMAAIPPGGGMTHHEITIPSDAVRGIYFLRARVVSPTGTLTPRTEQGKSLGNTYLRPLQVTAYRPATGNEPALGRFGPHISLIDAQVEPIDADRLVTTLTWRCDSPVQINYRLSLRVSGEGQYLAQYDPPPRRMLYPTSMWQPGELVTERYTLTLDEGNTTDKAQALEVVLYDFSSPTLAPAGVAYVPLKEHPRSFDVPSLETQVGARFGDQLQLLGYDLVHRPDALMLKLHWQAMQAMYTDYKVFVHLFDPATETIVTQDDAMPLRNTYPTRWWAEGEVVSDAIPLSLTGVSAGQYRLAIGVYDPTTGDRLTGLDSQGHPVPGNRLVLKSWITVP